MASSLNMLAGLSGAQVTSFGEYRSSLRCAALLGYERVTRNPYAHFSQGNHDKARPLYERSLAIREKALDSDHPHVAVSLHNLAECLRAQVTAEDIAVVCRRECHVDVVRGVRYVLRNLAFILEFGGVVRRPMYSVRVLLTFVSYFCISNAHRRSTLRQFRCWRGRSRSV